MFIFYGKITLLPHADNETITMVFLSHFSLNDPVSVHWQWSKDVESKERSYTTLACVITTVEQVKNEYYRIKFSAGLVDKRDYSFDGVVDLKLGKILTVTMRSPAGKRSLLDMGIPRYEDSIIPYTHSTIYVGKLIYHSWSEGDSGMATLVLPAGVSTGAPVCLIDQREPAKVNRALMTFETTSTSAKGIVEGTFTDDYYTYKLAIQKEGWTTIQTSADADDYRPTLTTLRRVYTSSCTDDHKRIVTTVLSLLDRIRNLKRQINVIQARKDEELVIAMRKIAACKRTAGSIGSDNSDEEMEVLGEVALQIFYGQSGNMDTAHRNFLVGVPMESDRGAESDGTEEAGSNASEIPY